MKIHTVFITYNRLELTKQAISSYLDTVSVPFTFVVVDNASTDGTREWLSEQSWRLNWNVLLLDDNRYPGYACNQGWKRAPQDATHLHRADNDFLFLTGWCREVRRRFLDRSLGQLGLRTDEEELHNRHNTGGNCVILRELWEKGLRYLETPWPEIKVPGYTEDSFMSPDVIGMGYSWQRVRRPCIQSLSREDSEDPYYDYYLATWADRGIRPPSP